jgi:hypothetical protein
MNKEVLLSSIRKGLKHAINDMFYFTDNEAIPVNAEYLITVNLAKTLRDEMGFSNWDFKIYLEKNKGKFSEDCIPIVRWGNGFKRDKPSLFRSVNIRNQKRIDIVVYEDKKNQHLYCSYMRDHVPVCAIEVKGVNPQKELVLYDLRRNIEYFELVDETGLSSIEYASFVAIQSYDISKVKDACDGEEKTRKKYEDLLSGISFPSNIKTEVITFALSYDNVGREEYENEDVTIRYQEYCHCYIGVIIIFQNLNIYLE